MDVDNVERECRLAFQASKEFLDEKCGGLVVALEDGETIVLTPKEVAEVASSNPELTRDERIRAIEEMSWTQGWAKGMCNLVSPELTGKAREQCVSRLARRLAEKVV